MSALLGWATLRQCAVWRHMWWNLVLEGGDREKWKTHEDIIRKFYGW